MCLLRVDAATVGAPDRASKRPTGGSGVHPRAETASSSGRRGGAISSLPSTRDAQRTARRRGDRRRRLCADPGADGGGRREQRHGCARHRPARGRAGRCFDASRSSVGGARPSRSSSPPPPRARCSTVWAMSAGRRFGPTAALFLLALAPERARPRTWVTAATVAALFVVHIGAVGYAEDAFPTVPLLFGVVVWGGAWVLGDRVRLRRERIAELVARAERAERDAERERRLAAAEERTRIARDLHDSAGHAINVILVQAGAAQAAAASATRSARGRRSRRSRRSRARRLTRSTSSSAPSARATCRRRTAGTSSLRSASPASRRWSSATARPASPSSSPRHGPRRPLAPGVDQAAYRILQEALTNAARHGDGRAEVAVDVRATIRSRSR